MILIGRLHVMLTEEGGIGFRVARAGVNGRLLLRC